MTVTAVAVKRRLAQLLWFEDSGRYRRSDMPCGHKYPQKRFCRSWIEDPESQHFKHIIHSLIPKLEIVDHWNFSGDPVPRLSKDQIRANQFRSRGADILRDPDWLDEGVRHWLEKQLARESEYLYTENEHAALARTIAAGTLFDSWDGHSVSDLRKVARQYMADGNDEDELILKRHDAQNVTKLRLGEMGHLVGFCRHVSGIPLAPFRPQIVKYDDFA